MRRNRYKQHLVKEEESDLPEDIYTEFIPDEKEDERCAKEIKCENKQTEYRYCGKDLPKIGVRAGDSMDDVFESINNSMKNIPTALTVEVKNTNGNTVVTQEVDTLNNVINFPDTEVQLKDNNGNIISNNYLPSGVIGSITAPACPTITADVSNSVGAVVDSGSVVVGGVIHLNAPDATYELLNSNNVQQDSGNIPSNENLQIFAPDAAYTVENSQGALQSSGSIASGESGIISAQDARVFVNYTDGTYIDDAYIPSGDTKTIIVSVIPCEDAEYTLLDEDGNEISSGSIASGDSENIIAPDSTYTQVNSLGSTLSSGSIASGGSATIIAPDSNLVVNGGSPIAIPSGDTYNLTVPVDIKEWAFQFMNQTDTIQIEATVNNIATFTSGSGINIGTVEVSTDGITYSPLVFPFSPSVGTWHFKRSTAVITATYTILE